VIFAWIEGWYNPDRISRGRGMRAPDEYEDRVPR
jgi:transposase InsO family protein